MSFRTLLTVPAHRIDWADELDFVGPRVRPARWAWLLLLAGVLSVMAVMPMVQQADEAVLEAQDAIRRLERAAHQQALKEKAMSRQSVQTGPTGLAPQAYPQAARLARTLAYPWIPLLSQVEAAAHAQHAVLLSLSLDLNGMDTRAGSMPDVHLTAAVRDDEQALQWVQAHGASAQLLDRQRLAKPLMADAGPHGSHGLHAPYAWRVEALVPGGAR